MSTCTTTNFPNGIKVGECLILEDGTLIDIQYDAITVSDDYAVEPKDDSVRVVGSHTITMPATRLSPVTIYAATDTVAVVKADGVTPLEAENTPSTNLIPIGETWTFIYDANASSGYYIK